MHLTDDEQAMLDGRDGPAVQRAMDLLLRYGRALGAERLVTTNNVVASISATTVWVRMNPPSVVHVRPIRAAACSPARFPPSRVTQGRNLWPSLTK